MRIALDYDGTYTADPGLWDPFLAVSRSRGHQVYIVTMRFPHEAVDESLVSRVDDIIYTGRRKKKDHLAKLGVEIDIWIDDQPHFIFEDAAGGLARAWRTWRTGNRASVDPVPPNAADPTGVPVPRLSNEPSR